MSPVTFEWVLGGLYALIGPTAWGLLAFAILKGRGRMRILDRPIPPLPEPPPLVSVLVPAKDEAVQIEKCLRSVLAQDYPNFEVIAIDDRSADRTGLVIEKLAESDARLHVLSIRDGELPSGWGGKSHALHRGLQLARGRWLLFVDADVTLEPDVLRSTIAWAAKREFDLISLLPRFVSETMSEGVLQPLAGAATSAMFLVALTNTSQSKVAFANGQYLCVRRDVYEAVGGHEAIRGTLSEDVALARRLKQAGYRPRLGWGESWARVRMYAGFASIIKGWSRNFYVGTLGKPWRILGLIAFLVLCCCSLLPAIAWGIHRNAHPLIFIAGWGWLGTAAAHYAMMTATLALMYRWAREPMWYALLFPGSLLVLLAICARSLWMCVTGKVQWRGTSYSRATLQTTTQGQPNASAEGSA